MKRLLALLLIAVLVLSVAGCKFSFGNVDDPDDDPGNVDNPGEDPSEDPDDDPVSTGPAVDGEFYLFSEFHDVFTVFKELKFDFFTKPEDGDPTEYTYSHVYIGEEELDFTLEDVAYSQVCPQYTITIFEDGEETVTEVWFNEDGDVVKSGSDGEYTTGDMAALALFGFAFHIIPFYAYNEGYSEVFTKKDGFGSSGWAVKERSTSTKDFGDGNVSVERYVFSWIWLTSDLEYDWEVAKIGGKHVFTTWKMDVGNTLTELVVERIIPF